MRFFLLSLHSKLIRNLRFIKSTQKFSLIEIYGVLEQLFNLSDKLIDSLVEKLMTDFFPEQFFLQLFS